MSERTRAVFEDDEFYLLLRGKTYHLHGRVDGRLIRMSCRTRDLARAKLFLENKRRELLGGWREDYDSVSRDWKDVAVAVWDRQKRSAERRGISFDLKSGEVYGLMRSTAFRCAVSGIPFSKRFAGDGKRDPWGPSIDRIENRQGYSVENSRVVCIAANIAMQDWGLDALIRLSRGVLRSSLLLADESAQSVISENTNLANPLKELFDSALPGSL